MARESECNLVRNSHHTAGLDDSSRRGFAGGNRGRLMSTRMALVVLASGLLLVSACAKSGAKRAADGSEMVKTKSGMVKMERLATLREPWALAYLPDGRLLVTEKPGNLRIYANGALSQPVSGVPKVEYRGQGGLLEVEVDPDFARNSLIYLFFTEAAAAGSGEKRDTADPRLGPLQDLSDGTLKGGAVARGRLEGSALRDVTVIWRQEPKTVGRGHYGGRLNFAPDGKLFILSGERQRFDPSQDLTGNLGKVVRINSDGTIPQDNPFVNQSGARPDVWSLGHRNPLGGAIHPNSGKLWIHEMGPRNGDELNIPEAGKNYGWPIVSNGDNYDGSIIPDHATRPEFAAPVHYWHPANSPAGMIFYTGSMFADWKDNILLGGLSAESLYRLKLEGNTVKEEECISLHRRVRDVVQAPDGSLMLLTEVKDAEGHLWRLTPAGR